MRYANRRPGLGKKTLALLCAALWTSLAHAAPDCLVTVRGMSFHAGSVLDTDHGYCVTREIVIREGDSEWIAHTTYESGKVVEHVIAVKDQKNAWFGAKEGGKDGYVSYGLDAWPEDEYTSHLPRPALPAYMVGVTHGKGKRIGEWSFSALFVDDAGKVQDGMRAYIGQLKAMGFTGEARTLSHALLTYRARNNAGFHIRVLCTGTRLCQLGLTNPTRTQREAGEKAVRKAKEEKERRRKQQFTDDFADSIDALPDE
ncbi:MAG: hypothetical protein LBF51_08070 [Zoogloeaceae bacterium]|jgi:hypothetical protein|nr:hypothetical protein [Zoogloeaceae bacterium]